MKEISPIKIIVLELIVGTYHWVSFASYNSEFNLENGWMIFYLSTNQYL